jgi:hypothetical protein
MHAIYWLRVFRLIGLTCKVLELLILVLSPEPIYGPFFLGANMTKREQWQGIPTELSLEQFRQFVLPHLSIRSRGPAPKLSLHALFGYILKLLYMGSVVSRRHFFFGAPDWHHVTGTMTAALSDLRGFVGERR